MFTKQSWLKFMLPIAGVLLLLFVWMLYFVNVEPPVINANLKGCKEYTTQHKPYKKIYPVITHLECVFVDKDGRDHHVKGYSRETFNQMKAEPANKPFAIKDANFRNDRIPYAIAVLGALFLFLLMSLFLLAFGFDDEEDANITNSDY